MRSERDVEVADTLSPEDPVAPVATSGGPPIKSWDRYDVLELLGKGGMGSVYKARDRRLNRTVALKFLTGADPRLTMRFLGEARAQARIDHPSICRVYEVGEVEGRAYIALQFVDGEPLHKVAARMSLEDKVAVMRDVASAIQEAHRLGIVHRDLKPANVMVERTDDGQWVPIVMDFGLARETTLEAGMTESGALLGTPAYMSPEQARGDVRAIDRRSDVYSLGATFYELLTGRPPFVEDALALALAKVIHDDPLAPRSLVASLPVDLETIALKCLAKDPAQRYASARALADDLGRYLNGEPIVGRRLSRWQRLRRRARRHRALVILGAWSLAIILAVGGLAVRSWIIARQEAGRREQSARLAEQIGRDASDIENHLREAYLWPLHDTRSDRQRMRGRMDAIAATRHDLGDLGDAVIHAALGRGHLALHEWREANDAFARVAIERQSPELHLAWGRALGELYHRAFEDARRSERREADPGWLAKRQNELDQQYLQPALIELERSRPAGDARLLEGLIALYRREFAEAERLALALAAQEPGASDAHKLAGDAAYAAAVDAFERGEQDEARSALERATTQYAAAIQIARSDASLYESAAQAWLQHAEVDDNQGRSPRDAVERALGFIDQAQQADLGSSSSYTTKAHVLLRWYHASTLNAEDSRPLLFRIKLAATRAVELDPHDARAWRALGNAHVQYGVYENYHGRDGAKLIERGLNDLGTALANQPDDSQINVDLAATHRWLADHLYLTGGDPTHELAVALSYYRRATTIDPRYAQAWVSEAGLHVFSAEFEAGLGNNPSPAVERARKAAEQALTVNPRQYWALYYMAGAQLALAEYLVGKGREPTSALASVRGYIDRAAAQLESSLEIWSYRLAADTVQAKYELRSGGNPAEALAAGRTARNEVFRLPINFAAAYTASARLGLLEAEWAAHKRRAGLVPGDIDMIGRLLAAARADADRAIEIDGTNADASVIAAEACLQMAMTRPSSQVRETGIAYVEKALAINPNHREAQRLREKLSLRSQ